MRGRGQAAAAAVLLAIIAGSIVLFLLIMDPEERDVLLNDGTMNADGTVSYTGDYLLQEYPGRIEDLSQQEIEHKLPSMHLVVLDQGVILDNKVALSTKHSMFSETQSNYTIATPNYALLDSLQLGFTVEDAKGQISMYFNGQLIFQNDVVSGDTPVVSVPSNLLQSSNLITIVSEGPGMAFWRTNYVSLQNVKLVAQETDYSQSSADVTVILSESEFENIESVDLKFQADCRQDSGTLSISLNNMNIYSGAPDCNIAFTPIEIDPAQLVVGQNSLSFSIDAGDYTLSHAELVSNLQEIVYPTYYFQVDNFEAIENSEEYVKLYLEFSDSTSLKQGVVYVNGYARSFDTRESSYVLDISEEVDDGNNALQLIPDTVLQVRELRVELQ